MGNRTVDETDRKIGAQLKKVREEACMSLHDVERFSEGRIKASILGAYERGERAPKVKKLYELARIYDVWVSVLVTESDPYPEHTKLREAVPKLEALKEFEHWLDVTFDGRAWLALWSDTKREYVSMDDSVTGLGYEAFGIDREKLRAELEAGYDPDRYH